MDGKPETGNGAYASGSVRGMPSRASETHTTNRVIRVPEGMWRAFAAVCKRRGLTMTDDLIAHIRRTVRTHGTDDERALLAEGEAELKANRSNKGGRPPREQS